MTMASDWMRLLEGGHNLDSIGGAKFERAIADFQQKLREAETSFIKDLKAFEVKVEGVLRDCVLVELKLFVVRRDMVCVLEPTAILYCPDCIDITDEFIEHLKMAKT